MAISNYQQTGIITETIRGIVDRVTKLINIPVSKQVNSVKNNVPENIKPIAGS